METRENTLSERERYVLGALVQDPDETAARRARALLEWAGGKSHKAIAKELGFRPAQVNKLTRAFVQERLEVFPTSALERAVRGLAGRATVPGLLGQHPPDMGHARHVAALALQLFDGTRAVHQVPEEWRRVLEAGSLLHNMGSHGDADVRHARTSHDIILAHDLAGFSAVERDVIACLALFYRKKVRPDKDALFVSLDAETRKLTLALAAILRVADGLDFSHTQTTQIDSIQVNTVVDVSVVGKAADKNAARANKKADLWREALTPPLVVAALPPVAGAPSPASLDVSQTVSEAARAILCTQVLRLRQCEEGVRSPGQVESVHDMRVACRRLNSAFRLLKPYLPARRVRKLRPTLEKLRDLLGDIRNLDVLKQALDDFRASASADESAGLQALSHAWASQRAARQGQLEELLDSSAWAAWQTRVDALLGDRTVRDPARVSDVVPGLLWEQYGTVRSYEPRLTGAPLETLHALRIDVKRLRYTLEFFRDAIFARNGGTDPQVAAAPLIEPLVALQDLLGTIQDAVIGGQAVTDFVTEQARQARGRGQLAPEFQAVAAYHAHLQAQIQELRATLPERWEVIMRPPYRELLAQATAAL